MFDYILLQEVLAEGICACTWISITLCLSDDNGLRHLRHLKSTISIVFPSALPKVIISQKGLSLNSVRYFRPTFQF